jgi:tannase/feruloyl esterase
MLVAHRWNGMMLAAALASTALAAATPVAAQNGYSMSDAGRSPVAYAQAPVRPQLACRALVELGDASVTIVTADVVAAADGVPAHCRVRGVIAPEIRFEVNLPAGWNRRFYMHGNGGFAGEVPDAPNRAALRATALRHGFVSATTNTGHDATAEPLASFAVSHQKVVDYAFRAVHLTATTAKRIAAQYYGRPVAYAYWDGCSTGGRQALIEAQRFPGDFDGIIAGAPVLNFVDTIVTSLWNPRALDDAPITVDTLKVVADAVYAKCDGLDGLVDGIIDDPRRCAFDPERELPICAAGQDGPGCVTAAQARALRKIYGGVISNGAPYFFPGQPIGAEKAGISPQPPAAGPAGLTSGWDRWLIGPPGGKSLQLAFSESFLRYMAFGKPDPAYDWKAFDFDKDPARMGEIRRLLNATDPDLSAFRARGGKLLMYFGWADTALTPYMGVDYYDRARAANGPDTPDFFRLFMVPGMFHCRGGVGADRFDALTPLINWVENGGAPGSITASRVEDGRVTRTRPLCPYPQVSRYAGAGSIDAAASFACADPR